MTDGRGRTNPTGRYFPSLLTDLLTASGLDGRRHALLSHGSVLARLWFATETRDCDWVGGSFAAFRREVLTRAGPLPSEFFLYGEDIEWGWRIKRSGWRVVSLSGTPIVHLRSQSSVQLYGDRVPERLLDAFFTFAWRRRNPLTWRVGWLAQAAFWFLMSVKWSLRAAHGSEEYSRNAAAMTRALARRHMAQLLGVVPPITSSRCWRPRAARAGSP